MDALWTPEGWPEGNIATPTPSTVLNGSLTHGRVDHERRRGGLGDEANRQHDRGVIIGETGLRKDDIEAFAAMENVGASRRAPACRRNPASRHH